MQNNDPLGAVAVPGRISPNPPGEGSIPGRLGTDGKILATAYNEFVADKSLTKKEIRKLNEMDKILEDASIKIDMETGDAHISQNDGHTFDLDFPKPKGGKVR